MSLDDLVNDIYGEWADKYDELSMNALRVINYKKCKSYRQYQRIVDDIFTRIYEEIRCRDYMPKDFDAVLEAEMILAEHDAKRGAK
jgi:hypothetical protein